MRFSRRKILTGAALLGFSGKSRAAFHMHGGGGSSLADKVLLVYNTNSSDSLAVKNYYVANRPGMTNVDVLALTCATTEQLTYATMLTDIRTPIYNWFSANPSRPKYYVVMCRGIPTRTSSDPNLASTFTSDGIGVDYAIVRPDPNFNHSIGTEYKGNFGVWQGGTDAIYNTPFLPANYAGSTVLVTRMDMGSLAATQAYIDKLKTMYTAMAAPNVVISAQNASLGGTNYYLDESNQSFGYSIFSSDQSDLISKGVSAGRITYNSSSHITSGSNVLGYGSYGTNSGMTNAWPTDGSVVFSGNSNWWLIRTVESYNGMQGGGANNQGCFEKFFAATAFGGTSYSKTPIGQAGHVAEPTIAGVENEAYFLNWEAGYMFSECAWSSRDTPWFSAFGDPLVKR